MKKEFKLLAIAIVVSSAICSCHNHSSNDTAIEKKHKGNIIAQTFKTNDGWGYAVFVNDKLFIKQSVIPVIEGNKGFAKEGDAIKVATLVLNKIKQRQMPAIRLDELQNFGIVK